MANVYDLKPGSIGVVAHTLKPHELNGWVKRVKDQATYCAGDLVFNNDLYFLNVHVPRGTFVFILSEQELKHSTSIISDFFYEVLWEETIVLLKRDTVFNPYYNSVQAS
jgi:hypothetical protein